MINLKRYILTALLPMGDNPMPEAALYAAVRLIARPEPTASDINAAVRSCESDGYVAGLTDDLTGRTWTLTAKGTHKARGL